MRGMAKVVLEFAMLHKPSLQDCVYLIAEAPGVDLTISPFTVYLTLLPFW